MRFCAGLEENTCVVSRAPWWSGWPDPERARSSRDRHAALSGRRAKPIFATVTSGFARTALTSGGVASVATKRLCIPLYGEGAVHYHFNGSLHKYGRIRKAGALCCSQPLRNTISVIGFEFFAALHFYTYLFMQNRGAERVALPWGCWVHCYT